MCVVVTPGLVPSGWSDHHAWRVQAGPGGADEDLDPVHRRKWRQVFPTVCHLLCQELGGASQPKLGAFSHFHHGRSQGGGTLFVRCATFLSQSQFSFSEPSMALSHDYRNFTFLMAWHGSRYPIFDILSNKKLLFPCFPWQESAVVLVVLL